MQHTLYTNIRLASHNLWLIPFNGDGGNPNYIKDGFRAMATATVHLASVQQVVPHCSAVPADHFL